MPHLIKLARRVNPAMDLLIQEQLVLNALQQSTAILGQTLAQPVQL